MLATRLSTMFNIFLDFYDDAVVKGSFFQSLRDTGLFLGGSRFCIQVDDHIDEEYQFLTPSAPLISISKGAMLCLPGIKVEIYRVGDPGRRNIRV